VKGLDGQHLRQQYEILVPLVLDYVPRVAAESETTFPERVSMADGQ